MTSVLGDPIANLASIPELAAAFTSARATLDPLLLDRRLRKHGADLAAIALRMNAHASATLEGAEVPFEEFGMAQNSPVARVADGVLEAYGTLRGHVGQPVRQVWAALASVAGREYLDEAARGRPRKASEPLLDPLHLGLDIEPEDVAVRLAMLAELLHHPTAAPALAVAAIAQAELASLQPFGAGNGVVARGFSHIVLAARGADPDFFAMTDVGLQSLGRSAYVRALQAYNSGEQEGIVGWCLHYAAAFERGATLSRDTLDALAAA